MKFSSGTHCACPITAHHDGSMWVKQYSCRDRAMEESRGAATAAAGVASSSRTAVTTSADTESDHHHQRAQALAYPEHSSWLCCVPCYWLRRNNSVHKASLTVATLIVTSLLVASPVLFLISSVPSREGDRTRDCHYQVGWLIYLLTNTTVCYVMPCILVEIYWNFRGI